MNQIARQTAQPATYKPNDTLSDDLRDLGVDSAIVHKDDEGQEQTIYLDRRTFTINDGHMFNGYLNLDCGPQPTFAVKGINVAYYDANFANDVDKEITIRNHILEHEQDTFQVAVDHRVILPQHLLCNREQDIPNDQRYYFILSSWADGGDLCESLDPFNENHCRNKFRQVFKIVNYLHSHGVFHRDLKPENFVLHGEDDDVYVIDFGKSRICDTDLIENDNEPYMYGTIRYTPPELNGDRNTTLGDPTPLFDWKKADIWALGVSLYTMLIGIPPEWTWDIINPEKIVREDNIWFQYICKNRNLAKLDLPGGNLSEEVTNLLQSMLLEDAADRISITDILRHDWFNEP